MIQDEQEIASVKRFNHDKNSGNLKDSSKGRNHGLREIHQE